jgi:hypothetical protein
MHAESQQFRGDAAETVSARLLKPRRRARLEKKSGRLFQFAAKLMQS